MKSQVGSPAVAFALEDTAGTVHRLERFRGRWLRWTYYEAKIVAGMDAMQQKANEARRQLIVLALAPAFGPHPPEALLALYEILLGQSQGPRMGSFIALYGLKETAALIRRVLAGPPPEGFGPQGGADLKADVG